MSKELKESMRIMPHQIENTDEDREIVIRNQTEILELKSTIMEKKNSLDRPNSISEQAEERTSEPKDQSIEVTQSEEHKEKRIIIHRASETRKTPSSMPNTRNGNRRRKGEKEVERIFEEIRTKISPSFMKTINLRIQEAQQTPSGINLKRSMAAHIKMKPLKDKDKEF